MAWLGSNVGFLVALGVPVPHPASPTPRHGAILLQTIPACRRNNVKAMSTGHGMQGDLSGSLCQEYGQSQWNTLRKHLGTPPQKCVPWTWSKNVYVYIEMLIFAFVAYLLEELISLFRARNCALSSFHCHKNKLLCQYFSEIRLDTMLWKIHGTQGSLALSNPVANGPRLLPSQHIHAIICVWLRSSPTVLIQWFVSLQVNATELI